MKTKDTLITFAGFLLCMVCVFDIAILDVIGFVIGVILFIFSSYTIEEEIKNFINLIKKLFS